MEKRITFGWDLIREAIAITTMVGWQQGVKRLQQALDEDEFYVEFNRGPNELIIVRGDSLLTVTGYPEEFYEDLKEKHYITKTVQ